MADADHVAVVASVLGHRPVVDESFGCLTLDVPAERWVDVAIALRDDPRSRCGFFDWLSAYDDRDAGLAVVARLWSVPLRHGVIMRTRVDRESGRLVTLTGAWAGADWHERETFEMFGIDFEGHPNLVPLLLPDGFDGHPLRKEFVLASRVAKDWPGRKEPGESDWSEPDRGAAGARSARRRALAPPGVPAPGSWGPR
jgi:NADH-quinone oxidoreductase subunit C